MPTAFGDFRAIIFHEPAAGADHVALLTALRTAPPLVRLHSECLTGDAFGSLRCDCGEQLVAAQRQIAGHGGVILYMRQEGRGIGLANKIRAYAWQDQGLDTVEANHKIGFADDLRDYSAAAAILHALAMTRIRLLTNNPRKISGLTRNGIDIVERVPLVVRPNPRNQAYLETKRVKLDHILPENGVVAD